jgi:hypothetical protein
MIFFNGRTQEKIKENKNGVFSVTVLFPVLAVWFVWWCILFYVEIQFGTVINLVECELYSFCFCMKKLIYLS